MAARMPGQRPRVSLGMPIYNAERYLEEALGSLLGQSFDDFELVISDNASTDRTGDLSCAYATKDERIKYRPTGFQKVGWDADSPARGGLRRSGLKTTRAYQSWALPEAL